MATPPTAARPEQPHLVSLVLQSKKALQHGEQLCSRANTLSNASAQSAIDVLALDAKVRWITDAVLEQLKLAASVAKSIEEKRAQLGKQVQEWDASRVRHADALDNILESLGSQLVPPDFHQVSSDSSLFGSQHSEGEQDPNGHTSTGSPPLQRSPTATLRNTEKEKPDTDRRKWKTLRDFVDDQAIEDALEMMESDRTALDDILAKTDEYPETLTSTITTIRNSLPVSPPLPSIEGALASQDTLIHSMAGHLESLAAHYDQMAGALRESEAGEAFSTEDLQDMNRDTDELPSIMAELEESVTSIQAVQQQLNGAKDASREHLELLHVTIDDLDELGEIMTEMLQRQESVEEDFEVQLTGLQRHLLTVDDLHQRFLSYQTSFSKLILEISRRRQYREAAENIVKGMASQLAAMTDEENDVRSHFNAEHGAHLPEDICLCIGNPPTKWEVLPWSGDTLEVLPEIDNDLISEATDRIGNADAALGPESL